MRINADFSKRAAITADDSMWIRSPESGVDRIMLDRIGAEVARATSVVRYAPGSAFASHAHAKGEEFLVLDGVFSDESGDYPAGYYVRNPPGTSHAPFSEPGCRILVKLRQFDDQDLSRFAIDTRDERAWNRDSLKLHEFGTECVRMRKIRAGQSLELDPLDAGTEVFVVSGALLLDGIACPVDTWLRFPAGDAARLDVRDDATVWIKTGHLREGR